MKNNDQINQTIIHVILVLVLITFLPNINYSQVAIEKQLLEFAKKSLNDYINDIINENNYSKFNFKSLEESKSAYLGNPYSIGYIGLNSLKTYNPDSSIRSVLIDTKTYWFPVLVQGEIRTKLEIIEKKDQYIAGEFGGIRNVNEVALAINDLPKLLKSQNINAKFKIMLVKIPAMNAQLLYIESSQGEFLIPVMIQPQRFELQNRQIYKAKDGLSILKGFATKINGDKLL